MSSRTRRASSTVLAPDRPSADPKLDSNAPPPSLVRDLLLRLASLKLTVVLLALAIFLVFVGTLAQVDKDIWQVVDQYFRASFAWVELKVFFPPSFFPNFTVPSEAHLAGGRVVPLGFYFPGGWLIGALLTINLFAAQITRFRVDATRAQLGAGLFFVALGALLTTLVIVVASGSEGEQAGAAVPRELLLAILEVTLGLACLGSIFAVSRLPRNRYVPIGALLVLAAACGGALAWLLSGASGIYIDDSSLRILWQLCKGQMPTMVLLLGCAFLYKKRAGVVLLHGGIALMMFGEVLTGLTAVEGQIHLFEGQSANFVRDNRSLELAVVDHSQGDRDVVSVIPESALLSQPRVTNDKLPFDIGVVQYYKNASIEQARPGEPNLATAGIGTRFVAVPARPASGTDSSRNVPAAYVAIYPKGSPDPVGTYLLGLLISEQGFDEQVQVRGQTYDVSLRAKRNYRPYSLTLVDVTKEDYPGTDIPRHYASMVHLVDDSRHVDRTVKIWMNNPLRFAGETFYQSGYFRDPQSGAESSTLQVVTNTGWMIPYVSCMLVATGMLVQFLLVLGRFLGFLPAAKDTAAQANGNGNGNVMQQRPEPEAMPMPRAARWSWLLLMGTAVLSAVWLMGKALPPKVSSPDATLYQAGQVPVLDHGRAKPMDSLARMSLQIISNRATFRDQDGKSQPAIRWFLDLITRPDIAAQHKVFRIEHPEVLSTLGLSSRDGFRYAPSEFVDHLDDFEKQIMLLNGVETSKLSTFQKKIIELNRKLALWNVLVQAYVPGGKTLRTKDWAPEMMTGELSVPLAVPSGADQGGWMTFSKALREIVGGKETSSIATRGTQALVATLAAYSKDDTKGLVDGVRRFQDIAREVQGPALNVQKVRYEAFYNHFEPCYYATILYAGAFVLAVLAWLGWRVPLSRAALGLLVTTFVLHTFVLISRIYISGRPPVTNLYSSAVFIGWAAVLFGLGLEMVYHRGIGSVIAAVSGFSTLLIAHFLGTDGDTFAVLQAVLDTQFWLATHVVCITLGYTATYVAGLLGILFIVLGVLTPSLTPTNRADLTRMIYGTLCFAVLFSFVGTVLGGLWADDSWGRFWGWDPKENGALIIVLWVAMVLHAWKGRLIGDRGLAILAIAGNITVSWSWFGVNELGIGLHSYGFTEGALQALGLFIASQLALIAIGLIPQRLWWSTARQEAVSATF